MEDLSRNKLQEKAMLAIYIFLTYIDMGKEINHEEILSGLFDDEPYEEIDEYVKQVSIVTLLHFNEMAEYFDKFTIKWKFSRLNRVAQAILLLSYASFHYLGNVDKVVMIDVSVKLAKKYLDQNDYKYINAILDKALC